MVKSEKTPHGYIYRATHKENSKVYLGQTGTDRWGSEKVPIEERWKEEVREAYAKKKRGEKLRYIENAIIKYGEAGFDLKQQDIAKTQGELNSKERQWIKTYDSMNPEKGYNMTPGGEGGSPSQEVKDYLRKVGTEKWHNDPVYKEKQMQERRERAKDPEFREKMTNINQERASNPEWREKMTKINQERAKNPEWKEKMTNINQEKGKDPKFQEKVSNSISKKWNNDPEYRKKQEDERKERAKNPDFINKMREIGKHTKKEIKDKRQFLNDIKNNMQKKEMLKKYNIGKTSYAKRIHEMFGPNGPKNYTELKNYLQNKDIDDALKDIEKREKEIQGEKSENKTNEKIPEGGNQRSEETDKDSADDKNSKEERNEGSVEGNQENKVEEKGEEPGKEAKDEKEKVSSEDQVVKPKGSPEDVPTEESDGQQQKQIEEPSEKQSTKSPEKSTPGKSFEFPPRPRPSKKQKGRIGFDVYVFKEDPGPHALTKNKFGNKQPKDYDGIDRTTPDMSNDFKGTQGKNNITEKDYSQVDINFKDKGNDFDGIDSPQEKEDKDFDNIDDGGHSEGRGERGGES